MAADNTFATGATRHSDCDCCEHASKRIAELEAALWYLVGDVEALHRSNIPSPGNPPITYKEIANLDRARALVSNYSQE